MWNAFSGQSISRKTILVLWSNILLESPILKDSLLEFSTPSPICQVQWSHLCYRQLLLGNISWDVDHFHPVPQGFWNCFRYIGSTNEEHLVGERGWKREWSDVEHLGSRHWCDLKALLLQIIKTNHSGSWPNPFWSLQLATAKQPEGKSWGIPNTKPKAPLCYWESQQQGSLKAVEKIIPWINPLAHQGSDPRSWHSVLGLAAQGVLRKDPLGSLFLFYPPVVQSQHLFQVTQSKLSLLRHPWNCRTPHWKSVQHPKALRGRCEAMLPHQSGSGDFLSWSSSGTELSSLASLPHMSACRSRNHSGEAHAWYAQKLYSCLMSEYRPMELVSAVSFICKTTGTTTTLCFPYNYVLL